MLICVVTVSSLALSACTSPRRTPVRSKTAEEILEEVSAVTLGETSVVVEGSLSEGRSAGHFRLALLRDGLTAGRVTFGAESLQLAIFPPDAYLKGSVAFWERFGHLPVARATAIAARWIETPSSGVTRLVPLSFRSLLSALTTPGGTLSKLSGKRLAGAPVLGVHSSNGLTLWVGSDKPLPVALSAVFDQARIDATFSEWDRAPPPVRPTGALPAGAL